MFCPKCKAEYRNGFDVCSDCRVALVKEAPEIAADEPQFIDYQEVLATYNPADVAFIKSLLEGAGIQYYFKGENFMYVRPLGDPVRLMIRTDQVEEAAALLENVELSVTGISIDKVPDQNESPEE